MMPAGMASRAKIAMQVDGASLMPGKGLQYNDDYSTAPESGNYGRLSDKLKEADIERRLEQDEIDKRENAAQYAREARERKIMLLQKIPDDMKAGTVDDFMFKEGVKDILEKLDYDLIGLRPVKERVREIASLLVVDKMRLKLGLETSVPSLHMGFTGAPGTGKTTVALRMGQILQRMGYCRTGHVVVATRDDLVGQYVGHTAPKTKEMVKKAMGGILLVDEAYYLYNAANDRDYGQESIEILLNVMENNKEDIIVVLAGYKDRMDAFYGFIPGMNSRIGNHIEFPDYEDVELAESKRASTPNARSNARRHDAPSWPRREARLPLASLQSVWSCYASSNTSSRRARTTASCRSCRRGASSLFLQTPARSATRLTTRGWLRRSASSTRRWMRIVTGWSPSRTSRRSSRRT